jgi:predicted amidophosphoribosyltransferase
MTDLCQFLALLRRILIFKGQEIQPSVNPREDHTSPSLDDSYFTHLSPPAWNAESFNVGGLTVGDFTVILRQDPHRLSWTSQFLQPEIEAIYACGRYISLEQHFEPWSELIRQAKHPPADQDEREHILSLVCGAFCSYLSTHTPHLLDEAERVVAVPANPARFALRGMSLPDEMGRALEREFGVPFLPEALRSLAAPDLQLRGMDLERRAQAVRGSMAVGVGEGIAGQTVLLLDDVVSSGATLREAARLLAEAGSSRVYAVCLASAL